MLLVRDVMSRGVVTIGPDASLKDAARSLVEWGISGLVVVDEGAVVRGVLSEADFLPKERGRIRRRRFWHLFGEPDRSRADAQRLAARTVGEAMSSPAVTIDADRPIAEAAARMLDARVTRLPVMDAGRMVGIVTRSDLLRAYLTPDERLADQIRSDLIARTMLLNPAAFRVEVTDGVARIHGRVDRRSAAEDLERLTAAIPGIVAVQAKVTWTEDDSRRRTELGSAVTRVLP
jgi:CBS domain-containing protein